MEKKKEEVELNECKNINNIIKINNLASIKKI